MATKEQKKEDLKRSIIEASRTYSRELAGKTFLYVYGQDYFEVLFPTDRFLHLTGVETNLRAKDFYSKAKNGILDSKQFYFTKSHPIRDVKKKLKCLCNLYELTNTMVCIVKNLATITLTYAIGITNLEFTLGLTEDLKKTYGKKSVFLPRTLRIKDKAIDISADGDIVDFIFKKDTSTELYNKLMFKDPNKRIPESVYSLIDKSLLNESNMK